MTTESTTTEADIKPPRWPIHAIWIGLVIAAGNLPLYFGYVVWVSPDLRDVPWMNAPFSWLGLVLCASGAWVTLKRKRAVLQKGLATTGLLLTLFLVGLFNWYVFSYSYSLPESAQATATESAAPDFALQDHNGQIVRLFDFGGKNVIIVFYRGHW